MLQKKQYSDKTNAKASEARLVKKIAEDNEHRARGIDIDTPLLEKQDLGTLALAIVEKIKAIVSVDNKCYAFVCRMYRIFEEAWASLSSRGNGTRIICDAYGGNVTPKEMKENYGLR